MVSLQNMTLWGSVSDSNTRFAFTVASTPGHFLCHSISPSCPFVNQVESTIQLNCWVEGDDRKHVFPVEIDGTKPVGTLKDVIKEKKKPAFDLVPADTLELLKVRNNSIAAYRLHANPGHSSRNLYPLTSFPLLHRA